MGAPWEKYSGPATTPKPWEKYGQPGTKAIGVTDGPTPAAKEEDWTDAKIPGTDISARSVGQTVANALPTGGAMVGATALGLAATPETLSAGTVPAAMVGSMAGGVVGNSLKKTLEDYFAKNNPSGYTAPLSKQIAGAFPASANPLESLNPKTAQGQQFRQVGRNTAEGAKTGAEAEFGGQVFNKLAPVVFPYLVSQFAGIPEQAVKTYMEQAPAVMKMALESKGPGDILPNVGRAADRIRKAMEEKIGTFRGEQNAAIAKVLGPATASGATHDLAPVMSALESGRLSVPPGTNPAQETALADAATQIGNFPRVKNKVQPEQSSFGLSDNGQRGVTGPRGVDLNGPQNTLRPQQPSPAELQSQLSFGLEPRDAPLMPAPGDQVEMPGGRPAVTQGMPIRPVDPLSLPRGNQAAVDQLERQLADHDAEARLMYAQRPSDYRTGQLDRLNTHREGILEELDKAKNDAGPQARYLSQRLGDAISREGQQMGFQGGGIVPRQTALTSAPMIRTEQGQMPLFEESSPWSTDATHVTPQTLYDVKARLQDISKGKGAYVAPGTMFDAKGEVARTARSAAAQARETLHGAYPGIAAADTNLSKLHDIDYDLPAALHSEGSPTGALAGAGAGNNVMNRNHLEDLDNLVNGPSKFPGLGMVRNPEPNAAPLSMGGGVLNDAQVLASMQHFGHPKLFSEFPSAKMAAMTIAGGPLSSPRIVRRMINMGMMTNPNYARALTPMTADAIGNILLQTKNPWATPAQEGQ